MKITSIIVFFCFLTLNIYSQSNSYINFTKDFTITVKDTNSINLYNAWAGGLNSAVLNKMDLNFDGKKDLIVFERNTSKILTFINKSTIDSVKYQFAPEYAHFFPTLFEWMILLDYNCDGKEDILSYNTGGIILYKNVSDSINGLNFVKICNVIRADLGSGTQGNIYVSSNDMPAIVDIDDDGDLDILSFHILGARVVLYKNLSVETYGNCDSLKFVIGNNCWGKFFESGSTNQLLLNASCYKNDFNIDSSYYKSPLHVGSTLLVTDLNNDNQKDLIIGDVDYPTMISAYNSSSSVNAVITSVDTLFPASRPINLYSMPAAYLIDIDNDNIKDLVVSPFDGGYTKSKNYRSVWYYKNTGTNNNPTFSFQTDCFLQNQMIDVGAGSYPVFYDYNKDSLTDLFISNYGYLDSTYFQYGALKTVFKSQITLYQNIGTRNNPVFKYITNDFAIVSNLKLTAVYPAFGDLDGDGNDDMLIGESSGRLYYYENIADTGNIPNFVFRQSNYQNIDVGDFSTPQLVDLDNDNKKELIIGEKKGNINYYKNTGSTANPTFTLVTDSLGKVRTAEPDISNNGYSVPTFFKDSLNNFNLFVGTDIGNIWFYNNISNNLNGRFTLIDKKIFNINEGIRSAVALYDLNNDGYKDMVVGNYAGGLGYYKGIPTIPVNTVFHDNTNYRISVYPNPAKDQFTVYFNDLFLNKTINLDIYNIYGKLIYTKVFTNPTSENTISTSEIKSGLYILKFRINNTSESFDMYRKNFKLLILK